MNAPAMPLADHIVLRPARDDDGDAVGRVIASVFADYPNCPFVPEEFPNLGQLASSFESRGGLFLVAEDAGVVVGSFGIAPTHRPGVFELHKVYLAKANRGLGIARALFDRALTFAIEKGAHTIILWTDTRFVEGHRFYEKAGFVRQPGLRALHDVAQSLEFYYRLDLKAGEA